MLQMDSAIYRQNEIQMLDNLMILDKIYVDIEFLKFIQLGSLISHQDITQKIYGDILKEVLSSKFVERKTNDVDVLFKNVPDIQTLLRVKSMQSQDIIFAISPSFDKSIDFIKSCLIKSNSAKRISNGDQNKLQITIDISILPQLSEKLTNKIAREYSDTFDCDVRLLRYGLNDIEEEKTSFDAYFIADIARFNNVMIEHLDASSLLSKHIFCNKILPLSKLPKVTEPIIPQTLSQIELVMMAASKFAFINPFPCLT